MAGFPCPGPRTRREFLRVGALALGGLTLPDVLQAREFASQKTADTSVILFWMWGGPSHMETYDLKPNAPSEFRGPFDPIATNVPGMDLCEHMPLQARLADKFSIIRSLHHEMSAHNDGIIQVLTGKTPSVHDLTSQAHSEHPDFGMIAARVRGGRADGLPQYVGVQKAPFMTMPRYLGLNHKAFETGDPSVTGFAPPNLQLSAGVDEVRLVERKSLIHQLDRYRSAMDLNGSLEGIDRFRGAAFDILTSSAVAKAFDLDRESPHLRDRYGRHRWGQSCLLARRLVEAGVSFVQVNWSSDVEPVEDGGDGGWDMHDRNFIQMQDRHAWMLDRSLSALLTDLEDRGLLDSTLVLAV
ncbi:MAG: DUF1501 domain-containing protein, partial [Planctomycetaceae bacterium]|nr:DUF1501 domain-containing protein [Planctomycetaceae bacterium]